MRLTSKALTSTIKKKVKSLIENRISSFPFHINRTISDNLPVFVKYRNNANLAFTHVRKTKGNKYILREELQQIVGKSPIKVDKNTFIIQGNHKHKIKESLDGLLLSFGFFFISLTVMALSWFLYGETITTFYEHHVSPEFGEEHTKKKLT